MPRLSVSLFIAMMVCLVGCSTIELREAQDSYAQAVRIESDIRSNSEGGQALMNLSAAQLAYKDTLNKLDEVIKERGEDLRSDRLLGSAKVMRALILWRITAMDFHELSNVCGSSEADPAGRRKDDLRRQWFNELKSIEAGLDEETLFLGSRDETVHQSLYGLYAFDILKRIDYAASDFDIECSIDWFDQAMTHFQEAAKIPAPDHEIQKWLALSNLIVQEDYSAKLSGADKLSAARELGFRRDALAAACPARYFWDETGFLQRLNVYTVSEITQDTECP